ncbi:hypothetical protein [Ectopseudomonas oleovorans]|uniref:Uncharacterized protein n=1 Tax=Ectopseudomonas oleovorans TaxID=301 RepID=A0A3D9EE54_ECTOL|nr:hypothetical protein [Pseudomonas oleovorans]RED01256.1 hypothetical protein DFO60_4098 [Pseudomonas oleovorans]
MQQYHYRSTDPAVVAIVQDCFNQRQALRLAADHLGEAFGGEVALLRSTTDVMPGGIKFKGGQELDVHWCRPDQWGFRRLRVKPKTAKGMPKAEREALQVEHQRLVQLWQEHCPASLDVHGFWDRLGVNTGNLLLCGGLFFTQHGAAYFCLGFAIDQGKHLANVAAGKPSAGWIEGAEEILPSHYDAARRDYNREAA